MIARFEQQSLSEGERISVHKYQNLQNLPHWHIEYELIFAEFGTAKVMVNSEQYTLTKGNCIFINSGEVHNIHAQTDTVISVIKIDQRLIDTAFEGKTPSTPEIQTTARLDLFVDNLLQEINSKQQFRKIISDCMVINQLAILFRNCNMQNRQKAYNCERYKALINLIEQRFADITFEEAADFMCYSKPYFSKYFSRISGMSFSEYLNIIRIAEAVSMIAENKLPVTRIAHACGFGTIRHFNRVFKELTGFTPKTLPEGYAFIKYRHCETHGGFDPTLSAPAII